MKKLLFIFLLFLVALISCKKAPLQSSLNAVLGYNMNNISYFPSNQDTIKFNSKDSTLYIQVYEDNLTSKEIGNFQPANTSTWINNVTIKTSQDEAVFVINKNGFFAGSGFGSFKYHTTWYTDASFTLEVSVKFTSSIIKNNNIIEWNSPIDFINVSYVSKFTNNTIEKQFVIKAINN